jgi:hypothetical protein
MAFTFLSKRSWNDLPGVTSLGDAPKNDKYAMDFRHVCEAQFSRQLRDAA